MNIKQLANFFSVTGSLEGKAEKWTTFLEGKKILEKKFTVMACGLIMRSK